jgi:HD-GYP domain-containing protein (c-di-GMP phosphodiesterase class II)
VLASLERAFQKKALQRELDDHRRHLEEMIAERTQQLRFAMRELESSYAATLEALGSAIDLRDSPTAGHSRRVFWYSIKIAEALGGRDDELSNEFCNLAMGAWLHDIGKLGIPDGILLKRGALTDEERKVMQQHVQIGCDLVKGIPFLADAAEIILTHHERCDGSGYPRGLKGAEIPLGGKVFAVADSFDAMTSERPYRAALPFAVALREIEQHTGTLFDDSVVKAFLSIPISRWEAIREESRRISISSFVKPKRLRIALGELQVAPGVSAESPRLKPFVKHTELEESVCPQKRT